MKSLIVSACCALLLPLAACASTQADKDTDKKATASGLHLSKAKLYQENDPSQALEIGADGALVLMGKPIGTLHKDGRLTDSKGELLLTVRPDGTLKLANGNSAGAVVTADNVLVSPDGKYRVSIDASGTLVGGNPAAPKMKTEGCQGPMARTCLIVMSAVMTAAPDPTVK